MSCVILCYNLALICNDFAFAVNENKSWGVTCDPPVQIKLFWSENKLSLTLRWLHLLSLLARLFTPLWMPAIDWWVHPCYPIVIVNSNYEITKKTLYIPSAHFSFPRKISILQNHYIVVPLLCWRACHWIPHESCDKIRKK